MNRLGQCYVQRKRFLFWMDWDGVNKDWSSAKHGHDGTLYSNSDSAIKALLEAQKFDDDQRKSSEWTVVNDKK